MCTNAIASLEENILNYYEDNQGNLSKYGEFLISCLESGTNPRTNCNECDLKKKTYTCDVCMALR